MLNYAIVEVSGRQYKITPNKEFEVDFLGDLKTVEADVLLLCNDKGVQVGNPYLKDKLKLMVVGQGRSKKIRVATYHAKANYRRVKGSRRDFSKVMLSA